MEEFTDNAITENPQADPFEEAQEPESPTEQEQDEPQQPEITSTTVPLPSEEPQETVTPTPEPVKEADPVTDELEGTEHMGETATLEQEASPSPTPAVDYGKIMELMNDQTEELQTIRVAVTERESHDKAMENLGLVSIVGLALACGLIGALIFSNYIRH